MKKIIFNNKSYLKYDEVIKYKKELEAIKQKNYSLILFPPTVYISLFNKSKLNLGVQNFYTYNLGSYTGEVSLEQVKDMNYTYTLIGHSERKKLELETYKQEKEKLFKSLTANFKTILCVGEKNKHDNSIKYIKKELCFLLKNIEESKLNNLSIAYEPWWAIGGKESLSIKKIKIITQSIKDYINKKYNKEIEVYYGGSVTKETIKDILEVSDGVLIGKISSDITSVKEIIKEL